MALNNLMNEPRRELTEQGLGLVGGGLFLGIDYLIVATLNPRNFGDWLIGLIVVTLSIVIAVFGLFLLVALTHVFGEFICNRMADLGFDPRPTRRYRR